METDQGYQILLAVTAQLFKKVSSAVEVSFE